MDTENRFAEPIKKSSLKLVGGLHAATLSASRNDFLVSGLLHPGEVSALWGLSGIGKTFVTLHLAMSIAFGRGWFGHEVKAGAVLYVNCEGQNGFGKRIRGLLDHWDETADQAKEPFDMTYSSPALLTSSGQDAFQEALDTYFAKYGAHPKLIVIDTLARSFGGGDENNASHMSSYLNFCNEIAKEFECHVLLNHHGGKDASKGMRGSSALKAGLDASFQLTKSNDQSKLKLIVEKLKDGKTGQSYPINLIERHLGYDCFGQSISTLAVQNAFS